MTEFPRTPDEITPEWLTRALRGSGHIDAGEIIRVHVEKLGEGLTGPVVRVKPTLGSGSLRGSSPIVIKMPTTDPETLRFLSGKGMFHREYHFYRKLASKMPNFVPRHYFVQTNPESTLGIIGLEDLGDMRTVKQGSPMPMDDATAAVKTLARVHAQWWNRPALAEHDWLFHPGVYFDGESQSLFEANTKTVLQHSDGLADGVEELLERLPASLPEIERHWGSSHTTLCMGDARGENMFFAGEGDRIRVKLIDWQLPTRSIGALDLATFLVMAYDVEQRRKVEHDLIETYYSELIERGVANYSVDQLEDDFRWALFYPMIMSIRLSVNMGFAERPILRFGGRLQALEDWNCKELLK